MKKNCGLTLVGLLLGTLLLAQQLPERRVTLAVRDVPLEEVLFWLIEKEQLNLLFRNDQLPVGYRVTAFLEQQPLAVVFDAILAGSGLTYELIGNQIAIVPKPAPVIREKRYTLSGYIVDAQSGERLIGAHITDIQSQRGTISNEYGFFSLTFSAGTVYIKVSYLGYISYDERIVLESNKRLQVALKSSSFLPEVIVTPADSAGRTIYYQRAAMAEGDLLRMTAVLPSLAGEPDPIRSMQLLPGITTGTDGIEGLHIRGGDAGQNLIMIDGVPVYNVSHAAGLFSVVNAGAVRSATLFSGGFPARYGGRLSGVLDIHTKDGNLESYHATAELGMLTSRMSVEGPIARGKTAFFFSSRQSFLHHFLMPYTRQLKAEKGETGQTDYRYYDINAKISHTFSANDRLYFSLYKGNDSYQDRCAGNQQLSIASLPGSELTIFDITQRYHEGLNWGNTVTALRWNHLFNDKVFANFTVTASELAVENKYGEFDSIYNNRTRQIFRTASQGIFRTGIEDRGFRADLHMLPSAGKDFRAGFSYNIRNFRPGALMLNSSAGSIDNQITNALITTREVTFYGESNLSSGKGWELNTGLHFALWQVGLRNYPTIQPRLNLSFLLTEKLSGKISAARMVQFVQLLSSSSIGLPTDLWVPATSRVKPAEAWVVSGGLSYPVSGGWLLRGEVYYKTMQQLLSFSEGTISFRNWEDNVTQGEGQAYGIEASVTRSTDRLNLLLSYTLAKADRRFDNINFGQVFPFKFDRRHDLKFAWVYELKPWLRLSSTFIVSSGFAFSIPLEKYQVAIPGIIIPAEGVEVLGFGKKNQYRMPAYHRLDVNVQFLIASEGRRSRHIINLGAYNLYNRKNPLYYDLRNRYTNVNNSLIAVSEFVQVWLLPLLPSVSYQFSF
jgi:hypothetical protein